MRKNHCACLQNPSAHELLIFRNSCSKTGRSGSLSRDILSSWNNLRNKLQKLRFTRGRVSNQQKMDVSPEPCPIFQYSLDASKKLEYNRFFYLSHPVK